jgi:hypothetical protein
MKPKTSLLIIISFILFSCNKSTVEPSNALEKPAVNLSIGNQYKTHHFEREGNIFGDWSDSKSILRDTTINGNKYFILSSGEILRSTSTAVIQWDNISEKVLYRFDVMPLDYVMYNGKLFIVDNIREGLVLGDMQKIIQISCNLSDSTIIVQYATKFGIFDSACTSKIIKHIYLEGAKIDTTVYGQL